LLLFNLAAQVVNLGRALKKNELLRNLSIIPLTKVVYHGLGECNSNTIV
jgi:hypothetical protein